MKGEMRQSYSFDEVAIVPGESTLNPNQTDIGFQIGQYSFSIPVIAAAVDAVVDLNMAQALTALGGLAVMNLEGLQTRYEHPEEPLREISASPEGKVTELLQHLYSSPIREELIIRRIEELNNAGARVAVSLTPASVNKYRRFLADSIIDILVVQSTVTTARHYPNSGLVFRDLVKEMGDIPVIVGNTASYQSTLELLEEGVAGILVGVGPGSACTSREVLGIGVPQVTAMMDATEARDEYLHRTGRYVPLIMDGGIRTGGDVCKSFVSGADVVMLASALAQAEESPGYGYNWGMATSSVALPRGTRVKVGTKGSLSTILFGPTSATDGTQNLLGALRTSMGMCGCVTLQQMHDIEMIIAPSIKTEGKIYQRERSN